MKIIILVNLLLKPDIDENRIRFFYASHFSRMKRAYPKKGTKKPIGRYHSPGQKPVQKKRAENYARRVLKQLKRISKTNPF